MPAHSAALRVPHPVAARKASRLTVVPRTGPAEAVPSAPLSTRFLLALYLMVPASVAFVAVDILLFGRTLGARLPFMPEQLFLFAMFFEMPHVVASTLLLADRAYLKQHGKRLGFGVISLLALVVLGPRLFGMVTFMTCVAAYTMYHVISQQCGIAKMLAGKTDRWFTAWRWLGIASATALYTAIFMEIERGDLIEQCGFDVLRGVNLFAGLSTLGVVALGALVSRRATRPIGKLYVLAHSAMVLAAFGFHMVSYPFFVLLMPRVVHDLTAFAFYVTHDRNRNAVERINIFQRVGGWLRVPVWLVTPVAAFLLALPVTLYAVNDERYVTVYFFLSAFHFFTESFTWQGTSPHRTFIRLA